MSLKTLRLPSELWLTREAEIEKRLHPDKFQYYTVSESDLCKCAIALLVFTSTSEQFVIPVMQFLSAFMAYFF